MLLRLLAENTFWCQTKVKGIRFAANMTADMQQNCMVDPHQPCLEPLSLHICGPGGLKQNLHRLQIHKDRIDFNECDGNWYLPNLKMCSGTSKKQTSLLNWRSYGVGTNLNEALLLICWRWGTEGLGVDAHLVWRLLWGKCILGLYSGDPKMLDLTWSGFYHLLNRLLSNFGLSATIDKVWTRIETSQQCCLEGQNYSHHMRTQRKYPRNTQTHAQTGKN